MLRLNCFPGLFAAILLLAANTTAYSQSQLDSTNIHITSSPQSGYVVMGDWFETDIYILTDSMVLSDQNVLIRVNDKQLLTENGRAHYRQFATQFGRNTYNVTATVVNGKETITRTKDFYFEGGSRCISASAAKMNVMFVGVDNPVFVTAAGISSNEVLVSATGANVAESNYSTYILRVDHPGDVTLHVKAGNMQSDFYFRAKRIPDPTPMFGGMTLPEQMDQNTFRKQGGVGLLLRDFDFDAKFTMLHFEVVRLTATGNRTATTNTGARFGEAARELVDQAAPGDLYLFRDIECQFPGESRTRKIRGFSVEIK